MKIWNVEYTMEEDNGIWTRQRVIAKDYKEAVEKADKAYKTENGPILKGLQITKIEREEGDLDAI
jgi:hypothetical protein